MYSLVNKESQHMFCNLFFAQETVSEWKEELLAGLEEMAREQVALLALDWKHWAWCYVASGDVNGEKEADRMGRKGGDWPAP